MRIVSQNKDYDIPYEHAVLACERIDDDECVVACVEGVHYVMGKYEDREDARLALDGVRNRNRINTATSYVFPEK